MLCDSVPHVGNISGKISSAVTTSTWLVKASEVAVWLSAQTSHSGKHCNYLKFHDFTDASKQSFSVLSHSLTSVPSYSAVPVPTEMSRRHKGADTVVTLSWWVILVPLSALPLNCSSVWCCDQTSVGASGVRQWRGAAERIRPELWLNLDVCLLPVFFF